MTELLNPALHPLALSLQKAIDAGGARKRVLLAEADDPRVAEAAAYLERQGLVEPVLLQSESVPSDLRARACEHYARRRNISEGDAQAALSDDPLLLAACLLAVGFVDGGIAGNKATTADVLRAGIRAIGTAKKGGLVSSSMLMAWQGRLLSFADCGVNPDPDAGQLAQIAVDTAMTHRQLSGEAARVALLSFSSKGSAKHALVDKVQQAAAILSEKNTDFTCDGELQFDAAFVPAVGKAKAPDSKVAGAANVLVFPDLNAGNIGYKIAQRMGGADAFGPILQGMAKPWMDLSRGCSAGDIVNLAVITAVLANG